MRCLIVAMVLLCAASGARSALVYVPDDYGDIKSAVSSASHGDTVVVRAGTYSGSGNTDVDFLGLAITLLGVEGAENTVVDCGDSARALYFHCGEDTFSRVSGFTFENGSKVRGGALHCAGASPLVESCVFRGNTAERAGGAIYCADSRGIIRDCSFESNTVTTHLDDRGGAAIHCDSASPRILRCSFSGGVAGHGGGVACVYAANPKIVGCVFASNEAVYHNGGGIYCYANSNPTIEDCTFVGNTANRNGGGVCSINSSPTITDCFFSKNEVITQPYHRGGGAIGIAGGEPAISYCQFVGNLSHRGGAIGTRDGANPEILSCGFRDNESEIGCGAYFCEQSTPRLEACEFSGGVAESGGGIYCDNGSLVLEDSVLHSNYATTGAAVHMFKGSATVNRCTLWDNLGLRGGALYARDEAVLSVVSTTIADCTGSEGAGFYIWQSSLNLENSIVASGIGPSAVFVEAIAVTSTCSDVWGNSGGDWIGDLAELLGVNGNISSDPLFCGGGAVHEMYGLGDTSPCAEENSSCGQIGAWPVACSVSLVQSSSWGRIKSMYR